MKKILYLILILLILTLGILLYSRFLGTTGLKTNEITIMTNIHNSYDGLKIVHFADLHYKKVITEKRVKSLIAEINKLKPDLVLFTGDLIDKDYQITNTDINFLIQELSKIDAKYGTFAVLGDHDKNAEETLNNIYIQSNISLLKNESTIIQNENNDKIFLGGLDSYLENASDIHKVMDYFSNQEDIPYKIILIHEPDYINTILKEYPNISLILSSHSINGSINLPLIRELLLPNGAKLINKPHLQKENTEIFISNGIGVNNVNFRLRNTPSINFYRIRQSN